MLDRLRIRDGEPSRSAVEPGPADGALRARSPGRSVALLALLLLASGCAHNVFHDENRDKQGQEAKKAVAEARLADAVVSLEKTFADVAAKEEANARDRVAYRFDLELRTVARARSLGSKFDESTQEIDGLRTVAENRLAALGMTSVTPATLKALRAFLPRHRARQQALEVTLADFRGATGHGFASCTLVYAASADPKARADAASERFLAGLPEDRRATARIKFPGVVEDCRRIDELLAEREKHFSSGGIIAQLLDRQDAVEGEIRRYELDRQGAQNALDEAIKAYRSSGAAPAEGDGRTRVEAVEARAARLRSVVASLANSGLFGEAGAQAIAKERLDRLETVLGAVAGRGAEGGAALTENQRIAVAIVRDLPALADEADKLLAAAGRPRRVPFLAAIDHQRLVVQGFEAVRATRRGQADAIRRQFDAALSEATALARVLEPIVRHAGWTERSIRDLHANLPRAERLEFMRALGIYADDVQRFRVDGALWRARELSIRYEESLVRSKFAAAQWDNLTATIATVLADYHASGIKRAELAEFFKALGLVAIGIGAAQ